MRQNCRFVAGTNASKCGISNMLRESPSNAPLPWPLAPRPFDEEAFGSWLGRVATKYRISVAALWEMSVDQPYPHLENVGWILFPCVEQSARDRLSSLARLNGDRLVQHPLN